MHDAVRPQLRWVPVVDSHGHRHMEMRWTCPAGTQAGGLALRAA